MSDSSKPSPSTRDASRWFTPRRLIAAAVSGAVVAALLLVAFLAPLPYTIMVPGEAQDALGTVKGKPVIAVSGHAVRSTSGNLRVTTIGATLPDARITLVDAVRGWFSSTQAVVPRDAVYPSGKSVKELDELNAKEMTGSQSAATRAALGYLKLSPDAVTVTVNLPDVGGPSAGLMFSLGIIDKIAGDGHGGDLSGGKNIAGTGTITADGTVGAVGGVALKTQAAREEGATVFLVPRGECADAKVNVPKGLRLVPVSTLAGAVSVLGDLAGGKPVPAC